MVISLVLIRTYLIIQNIINSKYLAIRWISLTWSSWGVSQHLHYWSQPACQLISVQLPLFSSAFLFFNIEIYCCLPTHDHLPSMASFFGARIWILILEHHRIIATNRVCITSSTFKGSAKWRFHQFHLLHQRHCHIKLRYQQYCRVHERFKWVIWSSLQTMYSLPKHEMDLSWGSPQSIVSYINVSPTHTLLLKIYTSIEIGSRKF